MPRRKYDAKVQAMLDGLREVHEEEQVAKTRLRAEVEKAYEQKLYGFKMEKSKRMNALLAEGVAKTDLGRQIGTQNWDTIRGLLELATVYALPVAKAEPVVVTSYIGYERVMNNHFTTGAMTYTFNGEELQKLVRYDLRDKTMEWVEYQPSEVEKAYVEAFVRELEPRATGVGDRVAVNEAHFG